MADVMWSIAQIAVRDGVSKPAVSKTVKKLTEARPDTPIERGSQGQVLKVSLAHYDEYRQRHVNPAKATAPLRGPDGSNEPRGISDPGRSPRDEESFDEARRQAEWLKVGREKIRHQEDAGQLIRKDKQEQAASVIGGQIQAIVRRLPNKADELALAVSKERTRSWPILISFSIP
ncbi:MAG: hypothetical protein ACT6RF_09165 [Allorhizobium sp.]|uniref:hypothetical protein n=1 Tax=Allorhizobium sp. TaxID=633478 RepID=UPI004034A788